MQDIKYCTNLMEFIALNHRQKLKQLRLWYWLKQYSFLREIKNGKIFIKDIELYGTQTGLKQILKDNSLWIYRPKPYMRFDEQYLILKSLKKILRENELTKKKKIKRISFRIDKFNYLKTQGNFNSLVTKSIAELPLYKKNKRDIVGRSFDKISERTGFNRRTVIIHLKKAHARPKKQFKFAEKESGGYAIYKNFAEANQTENMLDIKNFDNILYKLKFKPGYQDKCLVMIQQPNRYNFTGIAKFSTKNPA